MNESNIEKVINLFGVSRDKAMHIINNGLIDVNVLNNYDMLGKEVNRITDKFKPVFDDLSNKINKIKEDLEQTHQK